jgi:hypothetical protein
VCASEGHCDRRFGLNFQFKTWKDEFVFGKWFKLGIACQRASMHSIPATFSYGSYSALISGLADDHIFVSIFHVNGFIPQRNKKCSVIRSLSDILCRVASSTMNAKY